MNLHIDRVEMEELAALINQHFEVLNVKIEQLHSDMALNKSLIDDVHKDLEEVKKAFPKDEEGMRDYAAHHGFHFDYATSKKNWASIWLEIRKKIFSGAAWAVILFFCYAVWEAFKQEVKK